jgi:hypothetical protein
MHVETPDGVDQEWHAFSVADLTDVQKTRATSSPVLGFGIESFNVDAVGDAQDLVLVNTSLDQLRADDGRGDQHHVREFDLASNAISQNAGNSFAPSLSAEMCVQCFISRRRKRIYFMKNSKRLRSLTETGFTGAGHPEEDGC